MEAFIMIVNINYNGTQIWIPPHGLSNPTFLADFRNKFVYIENIGVFKVIGMGMFTNCSPHDDLFKNMMTYLADHHYPLRVTEMAATAFKSRAKSRKLRKSN